MDTAWLEAVLAERNGTQLVATVDTRPVALIGCLWATVECPSHYITDIAVAPGLRAQGLASEALQLVMAWPGHPPTAKWTAFVNPCNIAARMLLRKNAWEDTRVTDGMIQFERDHPS